MAFYELRQYKIKPGKMEAWLKLMEGEIIPFQVAKGMVITGSYRGEKDESVYVWTRRFESEAQRETLYKDVYESDHWKNNISPRVPECLDRSAIVVSRIVPTPRSLRTSIVPPLSSALRRAIVSPRPVPVALVEKYGSKMRARASASMPMPVSVTSTAIRGARVVATPSAGASVRARRVSEPPPGMA